MQLWRRVAALKWINAKQNDELTAASLLTFVLLASEYLTDEKNKRDESGLTMPSSCFFSRSFCFYIDYMSKVRLAGFSLHAKLG